MRLTLFRSLAFSLLLVSSLATAQDGALYEGEAPVDNQSEELRLAALPGALAQVLVKVTGDADAATDPVFAGALNGASRMMQQYRYRQDVVTSSGVPQLKLFLIARFNRASVENLVTRSGRTVWPSPRPRPLLWLAIDDGRGARLVGEQQAGAVASLTRRAGERGLTFAFPKGDLQDQTLGGPQAVWREDVEAVRSAAARYGNTPLLMGRLLRGDGGWTAHWRLLDGTTELGRWSAVDANAAVVLAAGADGAASALAQNYSSRILSGPPGNYDIVIAGLSAAGDYGRALQYLEKLPIVRKVEVSEAVDDRVMLRLALRTGIDGLRRLVEGGGVLLPPAEVSETVPVFQLEP